MSGVDTLTGNTGNDYLYGGPGADSLNGGAGNDIADYTAATAALTVDLGTPANNSGDAAGDTYTSIEGVRGSAFGDTLRGNAGDNILIGGEGFDIFVGGAGNDTFYAGQIALGGAQVDTSTGGGRADYSNLAFGITAVLGATSTVTATNPANLPSIGTDTLFYVEQVYGSSAADTFTATTAFVGAAGTGSNANNNTFEGNDGNDSVTGNGNTRVSYTNANGGVTVNFATGTSFGSPGGATNVGTDTFTLGNVSHPDLYGTVAWNGVFSVRGSNSADIFIGSNSDQFETFEGRGGNDSIDGGGGRNDRADYFNATAGIIATLDVGTIGSGTVVGNSSVGTDTLAGIERIRGSASGDTMTGGNGDNYFETVGGNDQLTGGDGFDVFRPGAGIDTINALPGSNGDQAYDDRDTLSYDDMNGFGAGAIVNLSSASIIAGAVIVSGGTALDPSGAIDTFTDIERVRGTNFADTFRGSDTANLGREEFYGFGGNDVINGGNGSDQARYDRDDDNGGFGSAIINLSSSSKMVGSTTVAAGTAIDGFGNTDTLISIEAVRGTDGNDAFFGSSNYEIYYPRGGSDTIDGGGGVDRINMYIDDIFTGPGATVTLTTGGGGTAIGIGGGVSTLFSIEDVAGSESNDTITGSGDINFLSGASGNDIIDAGGGDDIVNGGFGADTLTGGAGFDIVSFNYDPTEATYYHRDFPGVFPVAFSGTGVTVNLATGVGVDADGAADSFSGFEGIVGTFFNDMLVGDGNDNLFYGLSGNDSINGGGGTDTVSYAVWDTLGRTQFGIEGLTISTPNGVTVNLATGTANDSQGGTDTLAAIENVIGSIGNDTLVGNAGANQLSGGDGNDMLDGGAGGDTLAGGIGNDTYVVDGDVVIENPGEGTDTVQTALTFYLLGTNVENLTYTGSDFLIGFGNGANNVINAAGAINSVLLNGLDGADQLTGGSGNDVLYFDHLDTLQGGGGVDTALVYVTETSGVTLNLAGTNIEVVYGGVGNDVINAAGVTGAVDIYGLDGADQLIGGSGNDVLRFDHLDTLLQGGGGVDSAAVFFGETSGVTLNLAGTSIEVAYGGVGNDVINAAGETSGVSLYGLGGADQLTGGSGNDVLYFDHLDTLLQGGAGVDSAAVFFTETGAVSLNLTTTGIEVAYGGVNNDTLTAVGKTENTRIEGLGGNDTLTGGTLNDAIFGGDGDDIIFASAGTDYLQGDAGTDTVNYTGNSSAHTITDIGGGFHQITGSGIGTQTLYQIEVLHFDNGDFFL